MVYSAVSTAILLLFSLCHLVSSDIHRENPFRPNNGSRLAGFSFPHNSFDDTHGIASSSSSGCASFEDDRSETQSTQTHPATPEADHGSHNNKQSVKLHLKHRFDGKQMEPKDQVMESTLRDLNRIANFHRRITEKKNQNSASRFKRRRLLLTTQKTNTITQSSSSEKKKTADDTTPLSAQLMGTLKSGVSLGSGEYFMDVFVGTPPKKFQLIVDTGSDLNWIQCVPCHDCFPQTGPYYDPVNSSSFRNISCHDPRCHLVSSPDPPQPCSSSSSSKGNNSTNQTCPYFYWYGDSSNTTGDFALETFTVNLTSTTTNPHRTNSSFKKLEDVMFGCGHWNRGLFHGAAGLLGLGRGPLSFSSQLQSAYGHSFSYCLVDRNSGPNVSSKLIFGEDRDLINRHSEKMNFTAFLVEDDHNSVDTFYYVQIKSVVVGGEVLNIPEEHWRVNKDDGASGGAIIDSGTTLSYFLEPAYGIIKDAFVNRIRKYARVENFPFLDPCYNTSGTGAEGMEFPSFAIRFGDGAEWNFPVENYFIRVDEEVVCLAMLGTSRSAFSIIGNYQQQNFHVVYDTKRSRLGFAPTRCADM